MLGDLVSRRTSGCSASAVSIGTQRERREAVGSATAAAAAVAAAGGRFLSHGGTHFTSDSWRTWAVKQMPGAAAAPRGKSVFLVMCIPWTDVP